MTDTVTLGFYFPKDPQGLIDALSDQPDDGSVEVCLVFVDNDDHIVSSEFYTLRKLIRKKKNTKIEVHVSPQVGDVGAVAKFLGIPMGKMITNEKT
jgi:hypothetical protein